MGPNNVCKLKKKNLIDVTVNLISCFIIYHISVWVQSCLIKMKGLLKMRPKSKNKNIPGGFFCFVLFSTMSKV